jgi:hypothetical protein
MSFAIHRATASASTSARVRGRSDSGVPTSGQQSGAALSIDALYARKTVETDA